MRGRRLDAVAVHRVAAPRRRDLGRPRKSTYAWLPLPGCPPHARQVVTMIYALFGIFFVAMCLLAFLSAKTWHWLNITALCLIGLLSMFALVLVANYLDWQKRWRTAYERNLKELEEERARGVALKYGDPMKDVQDEPTLVELMGRFNRLVYQRGRVWRRCSRLNIQNNQVQLQVLPDDAAEEGGHGIEQGVTLYAFLEQIPFQGAQPPGDAAAMPNGGQGNARPFLLPGAYVGEFVVRATDAKTVTLEPAMPLDRFQQRHVQAGATWVLYEVMPIDDHYVFATSDEGPGGVVEYVEPNDDVNQPVFGEMDGNMLRQLFAAAFQANFPGVPAGNTVEQLASLYEKDGQPQADPETIDPDNLWFKVKFNSKDRNGNPLKPLNVEVSANPSISDDRRAFDTSGRAIDPRLAGTRQVVLKPGRFGVFRKGFEDRDENGREIIDDDLDDWIEKGICDVIAPIFVRKLTNYRDGFHLIAQERQRIEESIRQTVANTAQWQEAKRNCDTQIAYRSDEKMKLDGEGLEEGQIGELPGFRRDVAAADKLLQELAEQKTSLLEDLSRLYRANAALREQLAAVQRYLREQIDRKTEAAVTLK